MKYIFLFFCLFIFSVGAHSQDKAAQWGEDIAFLETELPKRHKDFFHHYSKKEFKAALDSLRQALPGMEDWQVLLQLQEIICRAGDSHTAVYHKVVKEGPVFPFRVEWFTEGFTVVGATTLSAGDTLLGKQLLAINGIPVEEAVGRLSKLLVEENESIVRVRVPDLLSSYYALRYTGIVDTTSAVFTFRGDGGHISNLPAKALALRSLKSNLVKFEPERFPFTWQNNRTPFWQEYLEEEQILYIRYNRCTSREVERKYGNKQRAKRLPSFQKFEQEIVSILEQQPVKKLVFDVSNNPGGSSEQGTELAKKISEIYKGRVFVIIGRYTFSSAVLNTLDFRKYCNATLVGEPTAGRPNHFGEVRKFDLPHSGAIVTHSTKYFERVEGNPPSIEPDVRVEISFSGYRSGADPAWEYIKSL